MDPTVEAQRLALEKLVASMDKAFRSFRLYEAAVLSTRRTSARWPPSGPRDQRDRLCSP